MALYVLGIGASQWEIRAESWCTKASAVVYFGLDGQGAGIADVANPTNDGTGEAITALKRSGISVVMLAGATMSLSSTPVITNALRLSITKALIVGCADTLRGIPKSAMLS